MNKLDEALGYIDGRYLDEAERYSRRPKFRKTAIIAAVCAALLITGAAAIGLRYFAPGVGIVDGGVKVLAASEPVKLGDVIVESVMMSDLGDRAELSCWIYREKELMLTPEMIAEGKAPDELTALTVMIDGREYAYTDASLSTVGFSYYNFSGIPVSEELTLRLHGEEARITLSEAAASDYATIGFGGNSLTLIPVSVEKGLYQAEIRDDFAAELAGIADDTSIFAYFAAKDSSGKLNHLSGSAILHGADCNSLSGIRPEAPAELSEIALLYVNYTFDFWSQSDLPEVKTTLPTQGESIDCSGLLFESDNLKITAVSVQRDKDGIIVETSCQEGDRFPDELVSGFSVSASAYVRLEDGLHDIFWSDGMPVYRYYDSEVLVDLSEGDEIVLRLDQVWMMYSADGITKTAFEPNLGEAALK